MRARYALIVLDTVGPERAEGLVRRIASDLSLHFFGWTRSKGLRRGPPLRDHASHPGAHAQHRHSYTNRRASIITGVPRRMQKSTVA